MAKIVDVNHGEDLHLLNKTMDERIIFNYLKISIIDRNTELKLKLQKERKLQKGEIRLRMNGLSHHGENVLVIKNFELFGSLTLLLNYELMKRKLYIKNVFKIE